MLDYRLFYTQITDIDTHLIYISNYLIEVEFYPVKYWTLAFKYNSDKYSKWLYLPTLDISIYDNRR